MKLVMTIFMIAFNYKLDNTIPPEAIERSDLFAGREVLRIETQSLRAHTMILATFKY